MTVDQFISQKLGSFGVTVSEADLLEVKNAAGLSDDGDKDFTKDNTEAVYLGLIDFIPQILARPTSISEGGVSISWNSKGLADYYSWLCAKLGLDDNLGDETKVKFY